MKRILVSAALIRAPHNHTQFGKFLLTQRQQGVHLAGSWEFPGGKIEEGESPENALIREIKEELGITIEVKDIYAIGHHIYTESQKEVILLVYDTYLHSGTPQALEVASFAWLTPQEVIALPLPPADINVVNRLKREYAHES